MSTGVDAAELAAGASATALSSPDGRRLPRSRAWLYSLAAVVVLAGASALSLVDTLLGRGIAYERDTIVFYFPLTAWAWNQLHSGHFPFWAPQVFGGYPIFADGEIGLAYPPVLLALLTLSAEQAFVAMRLFHLFVAALGAYALARAWGLTRAASTLAGLTFGLGSFLQAQIHHENIVRTAAWLPLGLAAIEHALRAQGRHRVRWTMLASLVVGLASLGLHTQILAVDLVAVGLYGLLRWWAGPIAGTETVSSATAARARLIPGGWWRRLRGLLAVFPAVVVLGVGVGGVQLVPLGELARFSPRGSGMAYADSAAYSLTPIGLLQLLFPFFFRDADGHQWGLWTHWESYLYVGIVPLVLALLALVHLRRREVWGWGAMAGVGLLLALGQYSPLNLHYLLWLVPGMSGLRAPGRFTLIVVLALAILAAFGLTWLQERGASGARSGRRLWLWTGIPVVLAVLIEGAHRWLTANPEAAYALAGQWYLALPRDAYPLTPSDVYAGLRWASDLANPRVIAPLVGLTLLLVVLAAWQAGPWAALRRWPGWRTVVVGATVLDLLIFGWSIHPRSPLTVVATPHPAAQAVSQLLASQPAGAGPYRVLASPVLNEVAPNRLAPLSVQEANGYTSLESRWHREYLARVLAVDDDLLDLWNVRYVLEPAHYGSIASYQGVSFLAQNPLLRAPAGSALGVETFRIPAGAPIAEIRVVSALVDAVQVPQDAPVAELTLLNDANQVLERVTLRAGQDAMEWAWSQPPVRSAVQHGHVQVAGTAFEGGRDPQTGARELSYAARPVSPPNSASRLEIRSVLPHGELVVYGVGLVDTAGNVRQLFGRQKDKYREVYRDQTVTVLENTAAYPRAFLVPSARVAQSLGGTLDSMARQPFDPRREVILAADTPPEAVSGSIVGRAAPLAPADDRLPQAATVERYDLDRVTVHTESAADAVLVLSDSYYPGWRVTVDGEERPLLRGDLLFRAVQVPAGSHTVEFRFDPVSARLGLLLTGLSLAAIAGLFGLSLRRASL